MIAQKRYASHGSSYAGLRVCPDSFPLGAPAACTRLSGRGSQFRPDSTETSVMTRGKLFHLSVAALIIFASWPFVTSMARYGESSRHRQPRRRSSSTVPFRLRGDPRFEERGGGIFDLPWPRRRGPHGDCRYSRRDVGKHSRTRDPHRRWARSAVDARTSRRSITGDE
jgi:hypothetical protein